MGSRFLDDVTMVQWRTFVQVAAQHNVTRAALSLGVSQATVSARIRALELALGSRLFERRGRGVQLTAAGTELLHHAHRLLDIVDVDVNGLTHAGRAGGIPVEIGLADSAVADDLMSSVLATVMGEHVAVSPHVFASSCGHLVRAVDDGIIPLAAINWPYPNQVVQRLHPLVQWSSPIKVMSSATSAAIDRDISAAQLHDQRRLVAPWWGHAAEEALAARGFERPHVAEVSVAVARRLVAAAPGVAALSPVEPFASDLAGGPLVAAELDVLDGCHVRSALVASVSRRELRGSAATIVDLIERELERRNTLRASVTSPTGS